MTKVAGKFIAGLIGYYAFPAFPVGGLMIGLAVGHAFDKGLWRALQLSGPDAVHLMRAQFFETTFTLLGFVAKADGRISESEVAQTEALFAQLRFNLVQRRRAIEYFKNGASASFDPGPTVAKFNEVLGPRRQVQQTLMTFLIGIALADGTLSRSERDALSRLAELLNLRGQEVDQLISMVKAQAQFHQRGDQHSSRGGGRHSRSPETELTNAYTALGLNADATDAEIKRRYRKLMSENHPDKLIAEGVPDELIKVATERAQEITAAYKAIGQARGSK